MQSQEIIWHFKVININLIHSKCRRNGKSPIMDANSDYIWQLRRINTSTREYCWIKHPYVTFFLSKIVSSEKSKIWINVSLIAFSNFFFGKHAVPLITIFKIKKKKWNTWQSFGDLCLCINVRPDISEWKCVQLIKWQIIWAKEGRCTSVNA